jgi:hypothetical protein
MTGWETASFSPRALLQGVSYLLRHSPGTTDGNHEITPTGDVWARILIRNFETENQKPVGRKVPLWFLIQFGRTQSKRHRFRRHLLYNVTYSMVPINSLLFNITLYYSLRTTLVQNNTCSEQHLFITTLVHNNTCS